ncbi:MAG: methyltransferase domain-containing protein [Verrucomicrobiota bacterium]
MTDLYHQTRQCRGCRHPSSELRELIRMNPMPVAGPLNSSQEIALRIPKIPLTLLQCPHCGLIQTQEVLNPHFQIDKTPFPTSQFSGLVSHHQEFANLLHERYELNNSVHFIEMGSNDGILLNALPRSWVKLGIDSESIGQFPENPTIQRIAEPLTKALVDKFQLDDWAHVVCLNNSIANIDDARHYFETASRLLISGGEFWIEEPSFDLLLADEQWDLLNHSQPNFWTLSSLQSCLDPLGLEYVESFQPADNINIQRHVFRKGSPVLSESHFDGISPHLLRLKGAYEKRFESPILKRLMEARRMGKRIAAMSASRRTQVYLNQVQILPIEFVIDEVPQRQNHWIPGRGLQVVPSSHLQLYPIDILLVSHASEIEGYRTRHPQFKGDWIARFGR